MGKTLGLAPGAGYILFVLVVLLFCAGGIACGKDPKDLWYWWIVVTLALVVLVSVAGWLVCQRTDGILIDERFRISLARFQWVMWLIILLGGYYTIAVWNVTHGGSLPKFDSQLLTLLGIVSGSAVLSNVIVDNKKKDENASAGPVRAGDNPHHMGQMDANRKVQDASWSDLFMGEDTATRYVVDISRLQKLVFTLILGITYLTWLYHGFDKPSGTTFAMPEIGGDSNFNLLLGISHLAYQGYKATSKEPAKPKP